MKKKLGYLILSLFFCFVLVGDVYAEDVSFELKLSNTSNEVIKGNYVDVKLAFITLNDLVNVDYCTFNVESTSGLEFKEVQALNSWVISNNNSNGNIMDISIKNNQNSLYGMFNIANIRYIVNENGNVKFNSAACYDTSGNLVSSSINMEMLEVVSLNNANNTMLKSLKINNGELNPKFSPEVTSYNINNFNANSLSLEYELNDPSYQDQVVVTVNDKLVEHLNDIPYQIVDGNNAMLITITVADMTTYNIFVYKELNSTLNNSISSITVNGVELEMEANKYDYVYKVSDDVESVEILATLVDSENFEFSSSSNAPATFEMNGKITAIMNVVSKDKSFGTPSVTYTVTVVNNSTSVDVNTDSNPQTSDTSMYIMALILLLSLFGSVILYQKNLNAYK